MDDYLFAAQHLWQFDGAALVAIDGKVILSRGYGMANLQIGEPNTPETRFYIGSITKQFTAAAILKLQEDKLLSINEPISRYLPQYPKSYGEKITIHHLLSHTSGIPNYTDDPKILLRRMTHISPEEIIDYVKSKSLDFEPGTEFGYSNSNYVILGQIIKRVSGQSYEAYLHRKILKLAGMSNSGYARREAGIPYRADGYTLEEHGKLIDALPIHFSVLHSAGALYSTVGDMLLWDQAFYNESVLNRASIELMFTPNMESYGYGSITEHKFGRKHIFHGGFLDGFNTIYDRWPKEHLCIVVFSNEDEAPVKKIARGLAAIIFNQPFTWPIKKTPIEISSSLLQEYVGVYSIDENLFRVITLDDDTLSTNLAQQPRQQIYPQAIDTFFFAADNTKLLVFNRDTSTAITNISIIDDYMIYPGGQKVDYLDLLNTGFHSDKISEPINLPSEVLNNYSGEYWLESFTNTINEKFTLSILNNGTSLLASVNDVDPVELFACSETEFSHKVAEFSITFILNNENNVTGCTITMSGVKIHGIKIR